MKRSPASDPSVELMQFAEVLAGKLILDAPCGYGRNTIALARLGCTVIAVDRDQRRLKAATSTAKEVGIDCTCIEMIRCDLSDGGWCFASEAFDAVVCVHFDFRPILGQLINAVRPSGYLYIETFGGQGQNYLELPPAGFVKHALSAEFKIEFYKERKVGPAAIDAVAVKAFCRRHH